MGGIRVKLGGRCYVFGMSLEQFHQPLFPPAIRLFPPKQDWSKAVLAAFRSSSMVLVLIRASLSSPCINQRQSVWPKTKRFVVPSIQKIGKVEASAPLSLLFRLLLYSSKHKKFLCLPLSDLGRKEKYLWCKSSGWGFILYQGGVHVCCGKFAKCRRMAWW